MADSRRQKIDIANRAAVRKADATYRKRSEAHLFKPQPLPEPPRQQPEDPTRWCRSCRECRECDPCEECSRHTVEERY